MRIFFLAGLLFFSGFLRAGIPAESVAGPDLLRPAVLEGRLVKLKQPKGEAVYRLALVINQKEYDVAYVCSSRLRLDLWDGRVIRIEGMRKWLPGVELPCIEVRKITPLWGKL